MLQLVKLMIALKEQRNSAPFSYIFYEPTMNLIIKPHHK